MAPPNSLRPAVRLFCDHLVRSRERARRAGTHPRSDSTIEGHARPRPGPRPLPRRRTSQDRLGDRAGRRHRVVPQRPAIATGADGSARADSSSAGLAVNRSCSSTPPRRWRSHRIAGSPAERSRSASNAGCSDAGPPATCIRTKRSSGCSPCSTPSPTPSFAACASPMSTLLAESLRVEGRPHPVPLDPVSFAAVEACLDHRAGLGTRNPHLIVTKVTKPRATPASAGLSHPRPRPRRRRPKTLRSTRLVDLVVSLDPKLVAEALGMNARRHPRLPRRPRRRWKDRHVVPGTVDPLPERLINRESASAAGERRAGHPHCVLRRRRTHERRRGCDDGRPPPLRPRRSSTPQIRQ